MQKTLSIIIPIYNVETYLEQCLKSVVCQLDEGMESLVEVILVDDGSTDGSGQIADRYAQSRPGMQVIHGPNAGVAAARNTGIKLAQGEWLYFMDSDDWLADNGIAMLLAGMKRYAEADMILFDGYRNSAAKEQPWEHFAHSKRWRAGRKLHTLQRGVLYYPMDFPECRVSLAAPWDKLYRREFLLRCGILFREQLQVLDDMVFNMEVLGKAGCAAYDKSRIYHYRYVEASITNKYQADRVTQDKKVWDYIEWYQTRQSAEAVWEADETEAFRQAYYCRIIRSFAICCRIHFYHRENGKCFGGKQQYLKSVLGSSPYAEAFEKVRFGNLEWRLKVLVLFVRCRLYGGVYLLHLAARVLSGG